MYQFIDTTEVSEVAALPSEALQINGKYIEDLVKGYRTLNVAGREALSAELSYFETGVRDGSKLQNKRYPARVLTITYQLIAETNEEFRAAFNQLGKVLNVENAELIFADEPDKYFIGTPETIGQVPPGRNAVTGEFEILCLDPFKYSVMEYEAIGNIADKSVLIDYNGTHKSFPILEADFYNEAEDGENEVSLTGNGDCGFVAFFTEKEKIVQLGDPDEKDATTGLASEQTLMNQTFQSATAWGTTAKKLWAVNSGAVAMKVGSYSAGTSGATTSGTLLSNKKTTTSSPIFYYTVSAKASSRTSNSVKVAVTITTKLATSSNYFGRGYGLKGSLYIGGAWRDVTIKTTSEYWKGNSGHTVTLNVTVSSLAASTTSLTGIKFKATRTDSLGTAGTLGETACSNLTIPAYVAPEATSYYLGASSYGSGSGWHGASITRQIGADAAGVVGATNFHFYSEICVGIGDKATSQLGAFEVKLKNASGKNVAGIRIQKSAAGNSSNLIFYLNDKAVNTTALDVPYSLRNRNFYIRKNGSNVQFNFNSYMRHYTDEALKDLAVTQVTFSFEQYGTSTALEHNGVSVAKFTKNNCATYKDIVNKFSANDVLEADCRKAAVYLNGINAPELGALGNDWEEFVLTPGLNQIGFAYSDWVADEYAPTVKVRYREVYL